MHTSTPTHPKSLILSLACICAITPLAISLYLSAFIDMAYYFKVQAGYIELTLEVFLLGLGVGQLVSGPLADRYGRRIFIATGLCLYIICSFLIATSDSIWQFWILRFFQAIGGGLTVVNINGIVRDLYDGKRGAKVFTVIAMIPLVLPMLAPSIGAIIIHFLSWQFSFIFLGVYGLLLLYFVFKLPETSSKNQSHFLANYHNILTNTHTLLLMLGGAFSIAGTFIFMTKAPFIYVQFFEVDANIFPFLFGLNALALIITSQLNVFLLHRYSMKQLLLLGVCVQVGSVCILLFIPTPCMWMVVACICVYIGSLGLIAGNAISLALQDYPTIGASANAINNVLMLFISAITGLLVSYLHNNTLEMIFIFMLITSSLAWVMFFGSRIYRWAKLSK